MGRGLAVSLALLAALGAGCDGGGGAGAAPAALVPWLGDYAVTFTGRVGGPYEPSGSIVSGTTTGVIDFQLSGTLTLAAPEPGVVGVPEGTTVPGVAPGDVVFGAAVVQNPLHVFLGTAEATRPGDFGFHSLVRFHLPAGYEELPTIGCEPEEQAGGPFGCSATFFHASETSGESVNLVYFIVAAAGRADGSLRVSGLLVDRHEAEAAAANLFTVPITSPILGDLNDSFVFDRGATFEATIGADGTVAGWVSGGGSSAATLVPQRAILDATFAGRRR